MFMNVPKWIPILILTLIVAEIKTHKQERHKILMNHKTMIKK